MQKETSPDREQKDLAGHFDALAEGFDQLRELLDLIAGRHPEARRLAEMGRTVAIEHRTCAQVHAADCRLG